MPVSISRTLRDPDHVVTYVNQAGTTITAPKPPASANTWFITIIDERDAMVSTEVTLVPQP